MWETDDYGVSGTICLCISWYGASVTICGKLMTMVHPAPYASASGYGASVTILWGKWLWWVGQYMWETDDYGMLSTICQSKWI